MGAEEDDWAAAEIELSSNPKRKTDVLGVIA
jgi:hypothetical protein